MIPEIIFSAAFYLAGIWGAVVAARPVWAKRVFESMPSVLRVGPMPIWQVRLTGIGMIGVGLVGGTYWALKVAGVVA